MSDFAPGWVTIGVPAGVGRNVGVITVSTANNFGGSTTNNNNTVAIGEGRSEIQVDLGAIQNVAEVFNAQAIPAQTYRHVELILDPGTPGNVVPLCPGSALGGEGCISYRAQFPSPTPTAPNTLAIQTEATINLSKGQNVVTPVLIQIDPGIQAPPTSFNQAVVVNPTITVPTNTTVPPMPSLATVTGTVTTNAAFNNTRPVAVTALLAGTDNIVITQNLPNTCKGKLTCNFTMSLPAALQSAGGTNYDFVASGKSLSYSALSNINLYSGTSQLFPLPASLSVKTRTTISFTGKILDFCTGLGIQAATLDLLVPDLTLTTPPDCSLYPRPTGCVVAATASTDESGTFPLPGNGFNTAPFNVVPLPLTASPYEMVVTAAGFDRTPLQVSNVNNAVFKCSVTAKAGACNVPLQHGILSGNVTLGGGASGPVTVLIAAEDHGTNNIENMTLVTIPSGSGTLPYSMNVPDTSQVATLDLFASTQDLFNGSPQDTSGHTIIVSANVDGPAPPAAGPPPVCNTADESTDLSGMACTGHGSVAGTVTNPQSTDSVVLSKDDVQIESTGIVAPGTVGAGGYSLCAPYDPAGYTLTRYQGTPPSPVGSPLPITLNPPVLFPTPAPSPGFTPTPCPGICQLNPLVPNGGCLVCNATQAPSAL